MQVTGAVVGRDTEAVKLGLDCLAAKDSGSEAFFRRLQSAELPVKSAMLVLRQCAVPKLNYLLAARLRSASRGLVRRETEKRRLVLCSTY
jgi:hypothetical protein